MRSSFVAVLLAALMAVSMADVYLHYPRGANDRCDEKSNNRNNDERLYDTENNAAGGYGICDKQMAYYEDTDLRIEWYSQHSCGNGARSKSDSQNPEIVRCEHIIQIACEEDFRKYAGQGTDEFADMAARYTLTDGISLGRPGADKPSELEADPLQVYETFGDTCTQKAPTTYSIPATTNTAAQAADCPNGFAVNPTCDALTLANDRGTFNGDTCECSTRKQQTYGYHEPEYWWISCRARQRNRGLFVATQNPNNQNGALRTRQEPNSDRYGFECVEERDYYPYWHPAPWRDIVVLTSNVSLCTTDILPNSQNTNNKCLCQGKPGYTIVQNLTAMYYITESECVANQGAWNCFGSWNWGAPACTQAPHQADNRLGNVNIKGDTSGSENNDAFAHWNWKVRGDLIPDGKTETKCVIRLRYNISTFEVDRDFAFKDNAKVRQNPVHTYNMPLDPLPTGGAPTNAPQALTDVLPIRMAINTAQYGRTFEDRTYVFKILKRPAELKGKTIWNLTYRGKRGNIAQVRNCVEYDFVPIILNVNQGDLVHVQFCGTDYNDNGNAGEGRAGTDRVNMVEIADFSANVPLPLNKSTGVFAMTDLINLAWLGQKAEHCFTAREMLTTQTNNGNNPKSCHFLNGVRDPDNNALPTAYFNAMVTVQNTGVFKYMSSRNNNFSNRSQKAQIVSGAGISSPGAIAGITIGAVAGVALIAGGVFVLATKKVSLGNFTKNRV